MIAGATELRSSGWNEYSSIPAKLRSALKPHTDAKSVRATGDCTALGPALYEIAMNLIQSDQLSRPLASERSSPCRSVSSLRAAAIAVWMSVLLAAFTALLLYWTEHLYLSKTSLIACTIVSAVAMLGGVTVVWRRPDLLKDEVEEMELSSAPRNRAELISRIRRRAAGRRKMGWSGLLLAILLAALASWMPSLALQSYRSTRDQAEFNPDRAPTPPPDSTWTPDRKQLEREKVRTQDLSRENQRLKWEQQTHQVWIDAIVVTGLKLSVLLILIYVAQVVLNFFRYCFRVADHLEAVADALVLTKDDPALTELVLKRMFLSHIGFGKEPIPPTSMAIEALANAPKSHSA